MSDFLEQEQVVADFSASDNWIVLSPIEQSIKKKIEAVGTPLKDWKDIKIYRGVLTGCNEAFIIDSTKREEILSNCQSDEERERTAELIRPILRGRDIKRYGYVDNGLYLINTHNGIKDKLPRIDIKEYPAIKAHLDQYWDKISTRTDKGDTPYNLRSCAYLEDFSKPKVVYMEIQTDNPAEGYPFPCYSYDDNRCVVLNTGYIMSSKTTDSRYVLGILNSRLGKFLVKLYVTQLQERQFRMLSQYVMRFPIVQPSKEQEAEMIQLVQDVLEHQSAILEKRIDELAFQIYGLSEPEIKVLMTGS